MPHKTKFVHVISKNLCKDPLINNLANYTLAQKVDFSSKKNHTVRL